MQMFVMVHTCNISHYCAVTTFCEVSLITQQVGLWKLVVQHKKVIGRKLKNSGFLNVTLSQEAQNSVFENW